MRFIFITAALTASFLPCANAQTLFVEIDTLASDGHIRTIKREFSPREGDQRISEPSIPKEWACEVRFSRRYDSYQSASGTVACIPRLLIPTTIAAGVLVNCPSKKSNGAQFSILGPRKTDVEIAMIRAWCY